MVVPQRKFVTTNQKHYPDLGSDMSSVCNFCALSSRVISLGETGDGVVKCRLFSQGYLFRRSTATVHVTAPYLRSVVAAQCITDSTCGLSSPFPKLTLFENFSAK